MNRELVESIIAPIVVAVGVVTVLWIIIFCLFCGFKEMNEFLSGSSLEERVTALENERKNHG